MGFLIFMLIIFVLAVAVAVMQASAESKKRAAMTPAQRATYDRARELAKASQAHGQANPTMICPHCHERGQINTKTVTQKKGISGGKATGAILTGGVSLLATGLSRKERNTEAYCRNCKNTWIF
jgi:Flp pilus assembly protein TadB